MLTVSGNTPSGTGGQHCRDEQGGGQSQSADSSVCETQRGSTGAAGGVVSNLQGQPHRFHRRWNQTGNDRRGRLVSNGDNAGGREVGREKKRERERDRERE